MLTYVLFPTKNVASHGGIYYINIYMYYTIASSSMAGLYTTRVERSLKIR